MEHRISMTPPRVDRNVGQDGIDTLVLNYRNQAGGQACEVLTIRGDLVSEGHATYLGASAEVGGVRHRAEVAMGRSRATHAGRALTEKQDRFVRLIARGEQPGGGSPGLDQSQDRDTMATRAHDQ